MVSLAVLIAVVVGLGFIFGPVRSLFVNRDTRVGEWRAVNSPPLGDSVAASLVTHRSEGRTDNVAANRYVPSDNELGRFRSAKSEYGETPAQWNALYRFVTGRPGLIDPSTDDLIQWTAHKWGIPEDWIRAQMANESRWHQSQLGDRRDGVNALLYPAQSHIDSDSVYESMGISQIKWRPDRTSDPGTEPLRWKSTAFNLDYYAATIRYYYDGRCSWCTVGYSSGQAWNSIGAWYQPSPWSNSAAQAYIARVQANLANRVWSQPGF